MSETAYVFLGLDLHLHVCEQLMLIQEQLGEVVRESGAEVRWVAPEHIHLTIKMLGEIDRSLVRPIQDVLRQALIGCAPFKLVAKHIRAFPSGGVPRLLYAQITSGEEKLLGLREVVEDALARLGVARDRRPFKAHVMLGRVRTVNGPVDLSHVLGALTDLPLGASEIRDVAIIQSHLTPKGAQYQVLGRAPLRAKADERA
jgi:2'-5' RNA ligase